METQNQIKRTLSRPESIEHIVNLLDANDNIIRTKLADRLCEHFGFFDPRGDKQRAGCLKALRELEQDGRFVLLQSSSKPGKRSPRRLAQPVPAPQGVPAEAGQIRGLRLIAVKGEDDMRTWNELMIQDHPRGAGLLVGRQIRYLVGSEHGWLGGLGFSAAALHLQDRDKWIGWDLETRRANLHHVVNMSRFLIRFSVSCRNLASRLLGMAIRKLPEDFEARYGHRPLLLESFVDTSRFTGTCYRAANWIWIGRTKGRGRQDRFMKRPARTAEVSVRYTQVELNPPPYCKDKDPIPIWVVHVNEDNPPAGVEPLEWFLLTTIDIKSIDDATHCVDRSGGGNGFDDS